MWAGTQSVNNKEAKCELKDFTEAMIYETLLAFNLCHHKNSLPSILISVKTY